MEIGRLNVSVVVPTYCEAENLSLLVPQISAVLENHNFSGEILVVDDDSPDETLQVCDDLARQHPLRLITRYNERGLSSAVVYGMGVARGDVIVVMDADLSHPPEALARIVTACQSPSVDFVIGSRFVEGGSVDQDWGLFRNLNARVALWLARGLTSAKDPLAGFFAIKQKTFAQARDIRPMGYKIGLELIVGCGCTEIVEVPIRFRQRQAGESKLSLEQQWLYLRQIGRLYLAKLTNSKRQSNPPIDRAATSIDDSSSRAA